MPAMPPGSDIRASSGTARPAHPAKPAAGAARGPALHETLPAAPVHMPPDERELEALGLADTYHGEAPRGPSSDETSSEATGEASSEASSRPGHDVEAPGMASELASTQTAPREVRVRRGRPRYRRGATIGRYIVLDTVGAGTMGTVYAAYDPELDRRIAVKLLATGQSRSLKARMRLLREARALARLSHPNVIQVYDVGVQNDDVFVAMELIEGESLHDVTHAQPPPPWRQVLRWYIEAARGLAAAHAVGLIHRDFKPSNVLMGRDGRVRVADFGLAAAVQRDQAEQTDISLVVAGDDISAVRTLSDDAPLEPVDDALDAAAAAENDDDDDDDDDGDNQETNPASSGLDLHITDPGTVMGTPAFMAPEQHSSNDVGPQADQYSFCVALYAGLHGHLPFPAGGGKSAMADLLTRKAREQIEPPPSGTDVPAWLHGVVVRGLAARPEQRWPSMNALIAALEDDPDARRRRIARALTAALAVVALTGLAVFGWLRTPPPSLPAMACQPSDSERQLAGVWDAEVRADVRAALLATARPYAQATFDRVSSILDAYAASWIAMRTEACEATSIRKEQSEQALDLRMYCLRQRRSRLQALTQVLAQDRSAAVLDDSVRAAMDLPSVDRCGDIDALLATIAPPEAPAVRSAVEDLQARLDRAEALAASAGRYREALVEALAVLDESKSVAYLPIQAQAMFSAAKMRRRAGDTAAAEALLRELIPLAARVHDDVLAAQAWAELLWVIGYIEARHAEALALSLAAQAAVERTGDELLRAELWLTLGGIESARGEYGRAAEYEARALDAQQGALGPAHPTVAQSLNNLAVSLGEMGDHQAARPLLERALAMRTELLGPTHPLVAQSMTNLARTLAELDALDQAMELHERSLALFESSLGPAHWMVGYALDSKGQTLLRQQDYEQARVAFERALAVREAAQGPNHPGLADSLIGLGEVYLAQANPEAALRWLDRALALGEAAGRRTLARARFGRARALWEVGRERPLALTLASQALDDHRALGLAREQERVARWLTERRHGTPAGAQPASPAPPR
jgi:serine/threonine protein kinase/tetratricopeptide (TPR) repeat protein